VLTPYTLPSTLPYHQADDPHIFYAIYAEGGRRGFGEVTGDRKNSGDV